MILGTIAVLCTVTIMFSCMISAFNMIAQGFEK